jgi:hypothetical protein
MKLNLRDLFWLILLAALVTMWWLDRSRLATKLNAYTERELQITPIQTGPYYYLDQVQRERDILAEKIREQIERDSADQFDPFK